ncbi:MAG: hypothetical protein U0350_18985 [Caldilineaceae bacterium]
MPDRFSAHLPFHTQTAAHCRWRSAFARLLLAFLCIGLPGLQTFRGVYAAPVDDIAVGCSNLVENGDFEAVNQVWLFSPSTTPPRYSSEFPFSGAQSLRLGADPGSPMAPSISEVRFYKAIPLPAPAARIILRFRYAPFYEDPLDTDRLEVEVRDANSNQSLLLQSLVGTDRTWFLKEADLLPFAGRAIALYFRVRNNGTLGHTWMFLDNVEIEYCAATPLPSTNTPTATGLPTATGTATFTPTPAPPTPLPFTATPLPPPPAGCINIVLNGTFETDDSWLCGEDPVPPYYAGGQRHEGARSMLLGNPPDSGKPDKLTYSSIRQKVTIPSNANTAELRWWHLYQTQQAADPNPSGASDRQEVLLLALGQKVLKVAQRVLRNDTAWQQEAVDLTPYRGQTFYLYFNVFNDGNGAHTWAYIDEVVLNICYAASTATPIPPATPIPATPLPALIDSAATATVAAQQTQLAQDAVNATATAQALLIQQAANETVQAALSQTATAAAATQTALAETNVITEGFAPQDHAAVAPPLQETPSPENPLSLPVTVVPPSVEANLDYLAATTTAVALANTGRLVAPKIVTTYLPPTLSSALGTIAVLVFILVIILVLAALWRRSSYRERVALFALLFIVALIWLIARLWNRAA